MFAQQCKIFPCGVAEPFMCTPSTYPGHVHPGCAGGCCLPRLLTMQKVQGYNCKRCNNSPAGLCCNMSWPQRWAPLPIGNSEARKAKRGASSHRDTSVCHTPPNPVWSPQRLPPPFGSHTKCSASVPQRQTSQPPLLAASIAVWAQVQASTDGVSRHPNRHTTGSTGVFAEHACSHQHQQHSRELVPVAVLLQTHSRTAFYTPPSSCPRPLLGVHASTRPSKNSRPPV